MKKRICVLLLVLAILMTAMAPSVLAISAEDFKKEPNGIAMIAIENQDCVELSKIKDLGFRIYKEGTDLDITIPVEKIQSEGEFVGLWLGTKQDRISDQVMKRLAAVQKKVDLGKYTDNPEDLMEELDDIISSFSIEIVGLPQNHYTYTGGAYVITNEIVGQVVDIIKAAYKEEYGKEFTTFKSFFEELFSSDGSSIEEILSTMDKESAAAVTDLIDNIDPLIEYMTSEDYTGTLIAGAQMACSCPAIYTYQITHKYYERVNDKLKYIGSVYEGSYNKFQKEYYLKGNEGDVIKAKDFLHTSYKGENYTYLGSYDMDAIQYNLSSFTLGEDWWTNGIVMKYVINYDSKSPDTGDKQHLLIYGALLVVAIVGMGIVVAYKRH